MQKGEEELRNRQVYSSGCGGSYCCCPFIEGPTGPAGPPGPTGPTGPAGVGDITGIQLQLIQAAGVLVENGQNVLFDEVVNQPSPDISYLGETGEFLLPGGKNYFVSWWAAVDGTAFSSAVEFAITVDGVLYSASASPHVTCQLSGSALVTAGKGPARLALMNRSGNTIRYAPVSVQAGMVIVELA